MASPVEPITKVEGARMLEYSLLLVDNNEVLLDCLTTWFTRHGFQVTPAHHPRLALAAAACNEFDAAVIDITLPDMNGLELIDRLKAITDIPIIVLSGDNDPRLSEAAIERGICRFLVKPVSMRAVEQVVRESVSKRPFRPHTERAAVL